MSKILTGKALAKFESERDVWQEVLGGVREIKAGGGKRTKVVPKGLAIVRKRTEEASGTAPLAPTANGEGARFELRVPIGGV